MSTNDILGAIVLLLSKIRPHFFPMLKDLLEKLSGESGRVWGRELKKFVCKKPCWLPNILRIDRSIKFDPSKIEGLGNGWSVEEDSNGSFNLTEIDLTRVCFERGFKFEEPFVESGEAIKRLKKAGNVLLDARVFQVLWEDQSKIPESWKELESGTTKLIHFDGTTLRHSDGDGYVLYLQWDISQWEWNLLKIKQVRSRGNFSAVLKM